MYLLSIITGFAFILAATMILTAPSWITGRRAWRRAPQRSPRLTHPGHSSALVRWALLVATGFAALSLMGAASGALTAGPNPQGILLLVAALAAAAASQYAAFAIGFTSISTQARAITELSPLKGGRDHEASTPTAPSPADGREIPPGLPGWR